MSTIMIGIDLGTTNSAIVINKNVKYEVVKNLDSMEYTPSVLGYNKGGVLQIGKKAYEGLYMNASKHGNQNYKAEVKRLMGTNDKISFPKVGKNYTPEEISSYILINIKESVLRMYKDFDTTGVVITVPAYFDTIQKEATKRAGELAGFGHVVLVQEPIAAAVAYGYESEKNENRLVYDLGGGTFDVAIISAKSGVLTIKGHAGDNFLGGKDIDNVIVYDIILPALREKFSVSDLDMDVAYNKLKYYAESAKKELTQNDSTTIVIDDDRLIVDDDGEGIYLEIKLSRDDFNTKIKSLVDKSIELCQEALQESGYTNNDISKIILVGGSTYTPYIRQRLETDLGIEVDAGVDPLTVVAKGAAIFGGSQVIPQDLEEKKRTTQDDGIDRVDVKLDYEPMVSDADTMVSGIIYELVDADQEYYIQIQSEDGTYSGNKLKLKNGKFFDNVLVNRGVTNNYFIYLSDDSGSIVHTNPEGFSITHGLSIAGTPISHSVSVSIAKQSFLDGEVTEYCDVLFPRGSILPLKKTETYHTVRSLKKGAEDNALPIKIFEGESKKPDRNQQILEVMLKGTDLPYDLPAGTEIHVTVQMGKSGDMSLEVYIPSLDLFKKGDTLRTSGDQEDISEDALNKELAKVEEMYESVSEYTSPNDARKIREGVEKIKHQIGDGDTDNMRKSNHEIKELKKKLDKIEDESLSDKLIAEYEKISDRVDQENDIEVSHLQKCKTALENKDREGLKHALDELNSIIQGNIFNTPEGMKMILAHLYDKRHECSDVVKANQLFEESVIYIENNDTEGMRNIVNQLFALMPKATQEGMGGLSGITK